MDNIAFARNISLIVRPAQIKMKFAQYIDLLQQTAAAAVKKSNFYLEYFPVPVLLNLAQEYLRKQQRNVLEQDKEGDDGAITHSRKQFSKFKNKIPDNSWAHFLSLRYHLLWLSGGSSRVPLTTRRSFHNSASPHSTTNANLILKNHLKGLNIDMQQRSGNKYTNNINMSHDSLSGVNNLSGRGEGVDASAAGRTTGAASSTSRLHFDRFENIMNVMQGSKYFHLFPPSESANLYGGSPVISGSFTAVSATNQDDDGGRSSSNSAGSEVNSSPQVEEPFEQTARGTEASSCVQHYSSNEYSFVRDVRTVNFVPNVYHTYSPVDILNPDFARYPRLEAGLKTSQVCEVKAGDRIFVPAHWWHQVIILAVKVV